MLKDQIASITLPAQGNFVSLLKPFVKSVAESVSLGEQDSVELGDLVHNVAMRLVNLDTDLDSDQAVTLTVFIRGAELVIAIQHKGTPVEIGQGESDQSSAFTLSIQSRAIDSVQLINLGKSGQRLELSKYIAYDKLPSITSRKPQESRNLNAEGAEINQPIEIRLINSSEGLKLSRCFYRVYGYTYGPSYVYEPGLLKSLVESGILVSAVAVDSRGEFLAHAAIAIEKRRPQVGELISLAVDPNHRNIGLAKKMHSYLLEQARERKLKGLFGEAVTLHPYSQRLCLALSGKESAMMLGYIPQANYRQISKGSFAKRQMAMVYFFNLSNEDNDRRVFVPGNHSSMIEKIYSHLNLERTLSSEFVLPDVASCGDTAFDLKVNNDIKAAAITLNVYCPDTVKLIESKLKTLVESGIDYVYLDLPMSNALTPYFTKEFESVGFFFSGIIPYFNQGDSLRLQFLNTSQVNINSAVVFSEFGREISDYVRLMKKFASDFSTSES
ncbi:MAG: GNAT family N-acetyltransferase [Pseudomonadota bacterium]